MIDGVKECVDLFTAKEITEFIAICFMLALSIFCIAEFFAWVISGASSIFGELIKAMRGWRG